jgi:diguanylate cyclase (GGDEF)-like protein
MLTRHAIDLLRPRRRPSSAWALALLLAGAGTRCLIGTGVYTSVHTDVVVALAVGIVCLLFGALVCLVGRVSCAAVLLALAFITAVTSFLVAMADNRADVAMAALPYPWTSLYAAHFLSRRYSYVVAAFTSVGFAAGILASGQHHLGGAWLLITATVVAVTVVTGKLVSAMRRQSETDPLTHVVNRAGFRRHADQVLASAVRRGRPVSLVLCDIDGLKQVNDARGHAAGDELLIDIVNGWRAVLRGNDVLARIGGDEFAVLLPDTTAAGAQASVDRLRMSTDRAFSAGIATWAPGTTLDALLAEADAAMYARKPRRGRVVATIPMPRRSGAPIVTVHRAQTSAD